MRRGENDAHVIPNSMVDECALQNTAIVDPNRPTAGRPSSKAEIVDPTTGRPYRHQTNRLTQRYDCGPE